MLISFPEPNAKQKAFLLDHHKHVGFGGARGGGKSFAVRMKAVLLCLKHAGIKVMIVRKTYPELTANHIKPLRQLLRCGTSEAAAVYNDSKKEMTFPNGSIILFGYCNSETDVDRYQGTEVDVLFIDEATLLSEAQIKALVACVRGVNEFPKRIYYTCNPGGKSHAYIKRLFIDKEYVRGEYPEEYSFIQSLVSDNKALMEADPEYVRQLEALPEELRKAWLEGDWNSFVGQAFSEWRNDPDHYIDRKHTHVIEPFAVPKNWKIWCGLDWGYSKPFAVGWFAVSPDGIVYHIREYYGCTETPNTGLRMEPAAVARQILAIEKSDPNLSGHVISRVGDPAIWGTDGMEAIGRVMEREGVYFKGGDHARLDGKMQFHHRLAFDGNGIPSFYVFSTCRHFIRTFPSLIYDEKHVEDIDTDGEDHAYDMARYVLMENPMPNIEQPEKKPKEYNPLDENDNYYKHTYNYIQRY